MINVLILIKRNMKLFFKDKGMFFTSLVTPAILLVLYATFLSNVYKDSFVSNLPSNFKLSEDVINGLVASQLISSLLAVSCVTVAFSSNFLMVQDKANGTIKDLTISPVKSSILSISYYLATLASTLLICLVALLCSLVYVKFAGWYMSFSDVMYLILDVVLLALFGTALSSVINYFLSSIGQITAVGTIVSAGYGFICGAYMPISSFGDTLQKVLSFLPGTYATSLLRNHAMNGVFNEMKSIDIPNQVVDSVKESLDCSIKFFDKTVSISNMYLILGVSIIILIVLYIVLNFFKRKAK